MKIHLHFFAVPLLAQAAFLGGCQTVGDQAPPEFRTAETTLNEAKANDVQDVMPSAYEAAKRKFHESLDLLDDSAGYQKSGATDQADATRAHAVKTANESTAISQNAIRLMKDMRAFNKNSGEYIAVTDRADKAKTLEAENLTLKDQNAKLEAQKDSQIRANATLSSENKDLANKPAVAKIPDSFKIAKPIAYFSTGSTTLEAQYQSDIQNLAALLTANKDLVVKLEGFSDPRGSAKLNQELAEKRVAAVQKELESEGVDAERIKTSVFGQTAENPTGKNSGALQLSRKVTATVSVLAH